MELVITGTMGIVRMRSIINLVMVPPVVAMMAPSARSILIVSTTHANVMMQIVPAKPVAVPPVMTVFTMMAQIVRTMSTKASPPWIATATMLAMVAGELAGTACSSTM